MDVRNEIMPTDPARLQEMMSPGPDEPVFMVNLLKFRETAKYEDGRDNILSGRDAYALYSTEVVKLLPKFNGEPVFAGKVTFLAVGVVEELWDEIAIVKYNRRSDLVSMSMSPEWQAISVHRTAGLKGQLNIETTSLNL